VRHLQTEFGSLNVILFPDANGRVVYPKDRPLPESLTGADLSVAQWVMDHNEIAGNGTDTLPGAAAVYFPLGDEHKVLGVLAMVPVNLRRVFLPEQQKLLDTFLSQIAQALVRVRLAEQTKAIQLEMEAERLRNSMLSAISHDLRTPLATIVGSASTLAEENQSLSPGDRTELGRAIYDEARRMSRLVDNILDMARLDTGAVELNRQWHPLEEIIGTVLARMQKQLDGRPITVKLPSGIPMVFADAVLLEQVLVNLLENVARYTPAGSPVQIEAEVTYFAVQIKVADRGPGIPKGLEELVFEKFYRGRAEAAQSGVGLGLAICRAIVEAHGGTIRASNRSTGGAVFSIVLPQDQPPLEPEAEDAVPRDEEP
jgi:two-component system sensor histidine kinase KdpD